MSTDWRTSEQTVMRKQPLIVDAYTAYDYKPAFRERWVGKTRSWVTEEHRRRLEAYTLLASYLENMSREYLPNDKEKDSRREYGDANLIVETLVDSVLGEDARVMVRGARRKEPNEDPYADTLQDWFDRWVEDERLMLTIMEVEADAIGLGDGVYVVGWDSNKGRPTVTCYDPGFYFPVLDPSIATEQFPDKVHIAWEYELWNSVTRMKDRYVRRITWELVDIPPFIFPWSNQPSEKVCLKSDGHWRIDKTGSKTWMELDESQARWEVNAEGEVVHNLDIGVDFIPVVHLPNTVSRKEHYGRSSLQKVLQILDDLQTCDTDLLKSARTTGSPPLGTKSVVQENENGQVTTYGPGQIIQGDITVVDTSRNLDALLKYLEQLLKRLSTNIRMPESVLGKLRPSEVPSGIALALSFGPLRSLVRRMRLSRSEKYPLLLKFVHRFAMLDPTNADLVPSGERKNDIPVIELAFGTFLPSDRAVIITDITNLFERKLLSRETAIRLLIEDAGLSIKDAEEEVAAIEVEDFEGARIMSEALESPDTAAEYLQRKIAPVDESRLQLIKAEAEARPQPFGGGGSQNGQSQGSRSS